MARNAYGVKAVIEQDAFDDWEWGDYQPTELINAISIQAAKTVLGVIEDRGRISLYTGTSGCFIRVDLGDDMGELSMSFAELIDDWLNIYGGGREAPPLIAALEDALAKLKAIT